MKNWVDDYVKFATWRDKYRKDIIQKDKKCMCGKYKDDSYCEVCADKWVDELIHKGDIKV